MVKTTSCLLYSLLSVTWLIRHCTDCVTKRRNSWACRGNPNPEQETIKGLYGLSECSATLVRRIFVRMCCVGKLHAAAWPTLQTTAYTSPRGPSLLPTLSSDICFDDAAIFNRFCHPRGAKFQLPIQLLFQHQFHGYPKYVCAHFPLGSVQV